MDQEVINIFEEFGIKGIDYHRDIIDCSSYSYRIDEDWEITDSCGHHHWYNKRTKRYSTLIAVVDCEESEDYPEDWHYECCICGEKIFPRTKPPSFFTEYVAGRTHITIKFDKWGSVPVTEDELDAIQQGISNKYDYGYSRLRKALSNILVTRGFDAPPA